jgi:predicted DCC family thiol-disulfide oxidoreductase YuxK
MQQPVAASHSTKKPWTIVVDDACPVVHKLSWLVRQWDRHGTFRFVGRDTAGGDTADLLECLSASPWSLLLLDEQGNCWHGPEAIPFILKNLPSGKLAAVTYTVPGTMWLTRRIYHLVSRNRRLLTNQGEKKYKTA